MAARFSEMAFNPSPSYARPAGTHSITTFAAVQHSNAILFLQGFATAKVSSCSLRRGRYAIRLIFWRIVQGTKAGRAATASRLRGRLDLLSQGGPSVLAEHRSYECEMG